METWVTYSGRRLFHAIQQHSDIYRRRRRTRRCSCINMSDDNRRRSYPGDKLQTDMHTIFAVSSPIHTADADVTQLSS